MEWNNINDKKPEVGDEIIGKTKVGEMHGIYYKDDKFKTKNGLYSFTEWKFVHSN
jgi:hypothetical protein